MDEETPIPLSSPQGLSPAAPLTTLRKAEYLRRVEVFSEVTVEGLFGLAANTRQASFAPGQMVFRENDIGEALYIVIEGEVELTARENGFREVIGPGQPFGVYAMLTRGPSTAAAIARKETAALCLSAEDFYNEISRHTELVSSIFSYLTRKAGLNSRR